MKRIPSVPSQLSELSATPRSDGTLDEDPNLDWLWHVQDDFRQGDDFRRPVERSYDNHLSNHSRYHTAKRLGKYGVVALAFGAAYTAGRNLINNLTHFGLPSVPGLNEVWKAIDAPPGASVSGNTYYTQVTHPAKAIVTEVQGGATLNVDITGGIFDVNLPFVGNPTSKPDTVSRRGNIMLTVDLNDPQIKVEQPPHPGQPASRENEPSVFVPVSALEVSQAGMSCQTYTGTIDCKSNYQQSLLQKVTPLFSIAPLLLFPEAGIVTQIAGSGLVDLIAQKLTGPQINPAAYTEDVSVDADAAFEHGCGHALLSNVSSIKAGLQKDFQDIFYSNSSNTTNSQQASYLKTAAEGPINVQLVTSPGKVVTAKTVTLKYADPQPTKQYLARQLGHGITTGNISENITKIEACKPLNPTSQNNQAEQVVLKEQSFK